MYLSPLEYGHTIWIGARKFITTWIWATDGTEVDRNDPEWIPGQPDNDSGNEGCMCLTELSTGRGWNDGNCIVLMPFICQIAIP